MATDWDSRAVGVLAFLQRVSGLHARSRPFQDLSPRSLRTLERLGALPTSLRFKVALRQIRHDWDLLSEESALDPDALRLQLRVLELSADHPEAERLIRPNFEKAPLGRLFSAMLAQAWQGGAREIGIAFEAESIQVAFDGREAMTIPPSLDRALRGILRFVEAASYRRIRPFLWKKDGMPDDVGFSWSEADRVTLTLL